MKTQSNKTFPLVLALAAPGFNLSVIHQANADGFVSVRSMNRGRDYHTATLLPNGKVLAAGGAQSQWLTSTELYDPASNTWTLTGSLRSSVGYFHDTATLLPNGKVLIAGRNGTVTTAELYDPATGQWTRTGSPNAQPRDHAATLLPNGKVLVTGGQGFPVLSQLGDIDRTG
ncbi:MAG: Kelch repeat-containing protein [Verrucomicrobiales bacterium]